MKVKEYMRPEEIPADLAHNACGMVLGHEPDFEPESAPEEIAAWRRETDRLVREGVYTRVDAG